MYNSYPNSTSSTAKWIFFGLFGVILMGVLLGANIKDATWLNSDIAAAQADRISIENARQQAVNELQIRLEAARTDAEIQQIRREQELLEAQYQHDIQALNQDLAHQDIAFKTWMSVITILAGAFALITLLNTTIWVSSKAWVYIQSNSRKEVAMATIAPTMEKRIPNLTEREPYDPWNDPNYRRQQRAVAQNQERREREELQMLATRMTNISDPAKMSGDKRNRLPQAGD